VQFGLRRSTFVDLAPTLVDRPVCGGAACLAHSTFVDLAPTIAQARHGDGRAFDEQADAKREGGAEWLGTGAWRGRAGQAWG
jgi:hypothetical protein